MRTEAALFRTAGQPFRVEKLDLEGPRAGEVLVKVAAAGVCHSDWHLMTGATAYPTPLVPGHEGAGVVEAVGQGVTRVQPGDPVVFSWAPSCGRCFYCLHEQPNLCSSYLEANWQGTMLDGTTRFSLSGKPVYQFCCIGCFAERVVAPEACCIPIPQDIPMPVAALIGCAVATGVGAALHTARVQAGSSAVVMGVGGIGICVLMGLRLAGAGLVIAVDTSPEKAEMARSFGATHALVAGPGTAEEIRRLTGGRGADTVFEAAGVPSVQELCLECVRPGGTIVFAGISPVGSSTNLPGAILTRREITVMGSYYGGSYPDR
ncbi:MAG: alcohol dehydrogenase catalytic domain-containing protein, partial [Armatimonadota bacterium]|nr:alcohol dehydrogenase catalytic domain-containing protein [Armatimonadota bacterium]